MWIREKSSVIGKHTKQALREFKGQSSKEDDSEKGSWKMALEVVLENEEQKAF